MENNDFKLSVNKVVRLIPPGSTLSYKAVATRAGNPRAARVVARIMSKNYDPTVPCHRVIRSDGSLGGYNRGGTKGKSLKLLAEGWLPVKKVASAKKSRQKQIGK